MPGKRGHKQKEGAQLPESSGQTQTTAEIAHAFAATDTGKKKFNLRGKLTPKQWGAAGLVVILLLAGGGYAIWRKMSEPEPEKVVYTEEGVRLRKLNNEQLRDELQKLLYQDKFSSAEQLINYQDDADSGQHKMLLALTYMNQGKPQDALRVLKDLERSGQNSWQLANTIATLYQQLGDKQNALTYYKKALDSLKKSAESPAGNDDVASLEQTIKTLEGQP